MNILTKLKMGPSLFWGIFSPLFFVFFLSQSSPVSAAAFCGCTGPHNTNGNSDNVIRVVEMNNGIQTFWGDVSVGSSGECTWPVGQEASTTHGTCPLQSGLRFEVIDSCSAADYYVNKLDHWGNFIPRAGELTCDYTNVSLQLKNIPPGYVCDHLQMFNPDGTSQNFPVDSNCRVTPPDGWGNHWLYLWIRPQTCAAPVPNVNTIPSCLEANSTVDAATISWFNCANPVTWVDIDGDGNWGNGYSNKNVTGTTSTNAPNGFSGGLQIEPDRTYYVRTWNGSNYSATVPFSIPRCRDPKGHLDIPNCSTVSMWTCDPSNFSSAINVHIYTDGMPGTGLLRGTFTANEPAQSPADAAAISSLCGGFSNRRYTWTIPNDIKTGTDHTIYAFGLNIGPGQNMLLTGSPQTINCPAGIPPPSSEIRGQKFVMPGALAVEPAISQTITLDGATSSTANPFTFTNITPGDHTLTTTLPGANWVASYTACINNETCHATEPETFGTTTGLLNAPAGGFVSVRWYYYQFSTWYKLKDASFHKTGDITNYIPSPVNPFDGGDTNQSLLIIDNTNPDRATGLVTTTGLINLGPLVPSTGVSQSQWRIEGYPRSTSYITDQTTLQAFIADVQAQKKFQVITDVGAMSPDTINIINSDLNLAWPYPHFPDNSVLLVNGNFTLNGPPAGRHTFNNPGRSVAIVATGTITISPVYDLLNGIFIAAGAIDIGTGTNELKVNGNLISGAGISGDLTRERSDFTRPSLYIQFNPGMYLNLVPYLSTIERQGRQLQ